MEQPHIVVVVREADDTHMNHEVLILISYEEEGSNGMVAVDAISDVRKIFPDEPLMLMVEDATGVHSTRVTKVETADVLPFEGPQS